MFVLFNKGDVVVITDTPIMDNKFEWMTSLFRHPKLVFFGHNTGVTTQSKIFEVCESVAVSTPREFHTLELHANGELIGLEVVEHGEWRKPSLVRTVITPNITDHHRFMFATDRDFANAIVAYQTIGLANYRGYDTNDTKTIIDRISHFHRRNVPMFVVNMKLDVLLDSAANFNGSNYDKVLSAIAECSVTTPHVLALETGNFDDIPCI